MNKIIHTIIPACIMISLTGCTKTEIESLDHQYSGCSYVINSDDYYNVGIEIHYANNRQFIQDSLLNQKIEELAKDLIDDPSTSAQLVQDKQSYCSDAYRQNQSTTRFALNIPKEHHDELIERLASLSISFTLIDSYYNKEYRSQVVLPVIDLTTEVEQESAS